MPVTIAALRSRSCVSASADIFRPALVHELHTGARAAADGANRRCSGGYYADDMYARDPA